MKAKKEFGTWFIEPEEVAVIVTAGPEFRFSDLLIALVKYGYIISPEEENNELKKGNTNYTREKRPFRLRAKGFDPIEAISVFYSGFVIPDTEMEKWRELGYGTPGDVKREFIANDVAWIKRFLSHPQSKRGTSPNSLQNLSKSPKRKGNKGNKGNA
jgi:hypothetical protein